MSMELRSPTAKILIVLACLVVVMAGIKAASTIMVPFFLSIFIAIACSPIIRWTSKFGVPKWLSITFVILLIVVFGFLLAGLVGQSMTEFRENLPEYRSKLDTEFAWVVSKLAEFNIHINRELIASHLDPATAMSVATNFISGMGGVLSNLFLILLTVIFMLFEADSIPRRLHIALADPGMKLKHIDRFIRSVNSYSRGTQEPVETSKVRTLPSGFCAYTVPESSIQTSWPCSFNLASGGGFGLWRSDSSSSRN